MDGICDLDRLLKEMRPVLAQGEFVFCTVPDGDLRPWLDLDPLGTFREEEGLTLILPMAVAQANGLSGSAALSLITLTVHSALEAVGLTAAIATALARDGISANVVAAYHHDHVFVPAADGERALAALEALAA
ncbi:ACT domain-containing protein [Rhizobium sp. TRM95111]|uniref:ACT domain-containing protein n=1 Tax=Rhizobium alarense TaxID=2846851 RepID=UPI001F2A0772|nr:ACT domain-containing protein [Rhizobium alarense]MCF3641906.1 ACT domain-containing protein [Rhizobium alarense]